MHLHHVIMHVSPVTGLLWETFVPRASANWRKSLPWYKLMSRCELMSLTSGKTTSQTVVFEDLTSICVGKAVPPKQP